MTYDVIVAGLGGMGSATLWQLAKRGQRVLGLERFDLGHGMGSSHGLTRIIRLAYFEHPDYVPLLKRAFQLWREAEKAADTTLLHVTGALDLAPEGSGFVEGSLDSCRRHDLRHEVLDARQLAARFPQFRLTDRHIGLHQPDGGFVASERAIFAHSGLALAAGADIRVNEALRSWRPTADGGVEVTTDAGVYSAGRLVLTAGAWMTEHAPALAPRLSTVKQAIGWFQTRTPDAFRPSAFPVFILTVDEGSFYGFPLWEHPGFKLGGPHFGREPIDPNDPDRTPSPRQVAMIRACLDRYIPDAAGPPLTLRGCIYTVTPDEHFILDRLPGCPQVVVASPCSGHGFKFASVIGEIMADMATDAPPRFDLSLFALDRFRS